LSNRLDDAEEIRSALERASQLAGASRYEEAVAAYTEIIEQLPLTSEPYFGRAHVRLALGDISGALEDVTRAIEHNPDEPANYFSRGRWRIEAGDCAGGVSDLTQAIASEKSLGSSYYLESSRLSRAVGLFLLGAFEAAARDCMALDNKMTTYLARKLWSVSELKNKIRSRARS
jgi:tetratricopeptide (TPR) repeat protein